MAFSTQQNFLSFFLSGNGGFSTNFNIKCSDSVFLKSLDSPADLRLWSLSSHSKSKYLSELINCRPTIKDHLQIQHDEEQSQRYDTIMLKEMSLDDLISHISYLYDCLDSASFQSIQNNNFEKILPLMECKSDHHDISTQSIQLDLCGKQNNFLTHSESDQNIAINRLELQNSQLLAEIVILKNENEKNDILNSNLTFANNTEVVNELQQKLSKTENERQKLQKIVERQDQENKCVQQKLSLNVCELSRRTMELCDIQRQLDHISNERNKSDEKYFELKFGDCKRLLNECDTLREQACIFEQQNANLSDQLLTASEELAHSNHQLRMGNDLIKNYEKLIMEKDAQLTEFSQDICSKNKLLSAAKFYLDQYNSAAHESDLRNEYLSSSENSMDIHSTVRDLISNLVQNTVPNYEYNEKILPQERSLLNLEESSVMEVELLTVTNNNQFRDLQEENAANEKTVIELKLVINDFENTMELLAENKEEMENLRNQLMHAKNDLANVCKENEKLKNDITKIQEQIHAKEIEITAIEQIYDNELKSKSEEISVSKLKIAVREKSIIDVQNNNENLLIQKDAEIKQLEHSYSDIFDKSNMEKNDLSDKIKLLEKCNNEQLIELNKLREKEIELSEANKVKDDENVNLLESINVFRHSVGKTKAELKQLTNENEDLSNTITTMQSNIHKLEDDLKLSIIIKPNVMEFLNVAEKCELERLISNNRLNQVENLSKNSATHSHEVGKKSINVSEKNVHVDNLVANNTNCMNCDQLRLEIEKLLSENSRLYLEQSKLLSEAKNLEEHLLELEIEKDDGLLNTNISNNKDPVTKEFAGKQIKQEANKIKEDKAIFKNKRLKDGKVKGRENKNRSSTQTNELCDPNTQKQLNKTDWTQIQDSSAERARIPEIIHELTTMSMKSTKYLRQKSSSANHKLTKNATNTSIYCSIVTSDRHIQDKLIKICNKIIQTNCIDALTYDELRFMHEVVYISGLRKNPMNYSFEYDTINVNENVARISLLRSNLIE